MFKFSTNSWHAKLNRWCYSEEYVEDVDCLCPYFWGTVLCVLFLPLFGMIKGVIYLIDKSGLVEVDFSEGSANKLINICKYVVLFCASYGVTFGIGYSILVYGLIKTLIVLGAIGAIGVMIFGIINLGIWLDKRDEMKRLNDILEGKPPKQPNVIIAYFRAIKEKHCPLVIWVK